MSGTKDITLHWGQVKAWKATSRFVGIIAGTGGGKTYFGPLWLYREICKYPGETWMVVSPTVKILKRTSLPQLVDTFRGTDAEGTLKESKGEYHLPDGGIIYLCTAEKPEYLEGGQFRGIWMDEAGQMKRWTWVVVQARVGVKEGRILITTTPYAQNWLYWEFFRPFEQGDHDFTVVQFPSTANPAYPKREYERMKGKLPPADFNMRYRGLFAARGGLVYKDLVECVTEVVRYPQPGDRRLGGLDFGWAKPSCALTAFVDNDELWFYREFYEPEKLTRDIALELERDATYWADPAAAREIAELTERNYLIKKAITDWEAGVRKVNEYFKDGRVHIPLSICPSLISESAVYAVEYGKERPSPKLDDHACDCLRYTIMGYDQDRGLDILWV